MIIVSFGMPKSASTYTYQVLTDICSQITDPDKLRIDLPWRLHDPFIMNSETLVDLSSRIVEEQYYVVKTHMKFDEAVADLILSGKIKVVSQFRNSLDATVSLIDAGEAERRKPLKSQREPFKSTFTIEDAIPHVVDYMLTARKWIEAAREFEFPCFDYKQITTNPELCFVEICRYIGITVDVAPVIKKYETNPNLIGEMNIGRSGRGQEELNLEAHHPFMRLAKEFNDWADV